MEFSLFNTDKWMDEKEFIKFLKKLDGKYVKDTATIDNELVILDFQSYYKSLIQKIDLRFERLDYYKLKKELDLLNKGGYDFDSIGCIIPYLYQESLDSPYIIYGIYGDIYLNEHDGTVSIVPSREFPTGKVNDEGNIQYKYPIGKFPEVYSFNNIKAKTRIAMAMGGCMNMSEPDQKMKYIYDFLKREENGSKS